MIKVDEQFLRVEKIVFVDSQDREVEAVIYTVGCGFAMQTTIVTYGGENIYNFHSAGGHRSEYATTTVRCDSPIQQYQFGGVRGESFGDMDERYAKAREAFLSSLPAGLREHETLQKMF